MENPGGGDVHVLKLIDYLRRAGHQVDLYDPWKSKFKDYQTVVFWGSGKAFLQPMLRAKASGAKAYLCSIYWSSVLSDLFLNVPVGQRMNLFIHDIVKRVAPWAGRGTARQRMFQIADGILVSSPREGRIVSRHFRVPQQKILPIWNGVDAAFADAEPSLFVKEYGLSDFVLCVGRLDPRKNQLRLIKAVKGLKVPLVIIGGAMPEYKEYYELCRREADENVIFLPPMKNQDSMLRSAYAACRVFAMPSFFETPSIAALEAGLCGANLVITPYGTTKDFFKDYPIYVKPFFVRDIRNGVLSALDSIKDDRLQKHIWQNFTWEKVAEIFVKAVEQVQNL